MNCGWCWQRGTKIPDCPGCKGSGEAVCRECGDAAVFDLEGDYLCEDCLAEAIEKEMENPE